MFKKSVFISAVFAALLGTSAAFAASPGMATTNTQLLAGPSARHHVVDTLPKGTKFMVQGCAANSGWCAVHYGTAKGWVQSKNMSIRSPEKVAPLAAVFDVPSTRIALVFNNGQRVFMNAPSSIVVRNTGKGLQAGKVITAPNGVTLTRPVAISTNGIMTTKGAVKTADAGRMTPAKLINIKPSHVVKITVLDEVAPGVVEVSGMNTAQKIRYNPHI